MYQEDKCQYYMDEDFDEPKSKKEIFEDMKKADKGYYSWTRPVPGSRKPHKIEAYSSGDVGSRIRDAVTGDRYRNYLVGSKNEDLFFKVRICTGEFGGREGPTLFYSSPEEYERHTRSVVNEEMKNKWLSKNTRADLRDKKEVEREEDEDRNYIIVH